MSSGARPVDRRLLVAGFALLLGVCALLSFTWLAVGAVVAAAAHLPAVAAGLAAAAAGGSRWAGGVLDAVPRSEPAAQVVLDYGFSLLAVAVAIALAVSPAARTGTWSIWLLVLAVIGSAGAFNLQAHAAAVAVESAVGVQLGALHQVLLHGVACAAYVVALLAFPPGRRVRPGAGAARPAVVAAGAGSLLLVGFGTALLPHTLSCVLFFGFLVPLAGLAGLPRRVHRGATAVERTRARLLFSVLVAAVVVAVVLALITVLLWSIGWTGLLLVDPTAHGPRAEPTALLFWFSRLACVAIAGGVLVAMRPGALWAAERRFSRGLAAALVAALVGGGYIVVRAVAEFVLGRGAPVAVVAATVLAAVALLPVYVRAERLVDRLLYGVRPTPYSVLARIAALSRATATDAPDLAGVAEAVGRGLGATTARLTVVRPGLRDRTYAWAEPGVDPPEALVEVPVHYGAERIGTVAVDGAAVAGVHVERHRLLEDIADSLGGVLQASRTGIELERQLRAALAHAHEIAVSRRAVVAEMDGERRRIERNLHDGAQHHLVSLRLILGLVEHQVATAQFAQAVARLDGVAGQIDTAESILAETAAGVSSPLLAEVGLVGALRTELACGHPPAELDADEVAEGARFPPDVEAAVYFCCLEAVNNARKHAPGARIRVRLAPDDGRLHFTVHDDGPGWDPATSGATSGRGLRNVTARVAAVAGRIELRSEPGAGTTVEGSVPLPSEPAPVVEPAAPERAGPAPDSLRQRVHHALGTAGELYGPTTSAGVVRDIAERLDGPLRAAVTGAPDSGAAALVEALGPLTGMEFEHVAPGAAVPAADAVVLVLRHGHPEDAALFSALHTGPVPHRPAHAIGVLALGAPDAQAERAAADCMARPDVRRLCHVVTPVSGLLAGTGPVDRDGVSRLREHVEQAFLRRADALAARSALLALEALVRADPPGDGDARLRYELDRIRGGTHELTEIDLVDALRAGELELADGDRSAAARLLGADGPQPCTRLGLPPDAGAPRVAQAAADELARWQRRAGHPMSTHDLRVVAAALVQTCEQLLAAVDRVATPS